MIDTLFSAEQVNTIRNGVRTYIRLMGFIHDQNPLELKWLSDEYELHMTLDSLARCVKASAPMIGKRKHQGADYNIARDVKNDMQTLLLSGRTEAESALLAKRNQPMFYLVVCPILDLFALPFDHQQAIDIVDDIVNDVKQMLWAGTDYGDHDDALVARMQLNALIKQHEAARMLENSTKRKRKTRRNPIAEIIHFDEDEPEELMYE